MSDVIRLKTSTKEDLYKLRELLQKNFNFSFNPNCSDSDLVDLCVYGYLNYLKHNTNDILKDFK